MATATEQVTECCICSSILEKPKLLPCHHTFCETCIEKLTKQSRVVCPTCRRVCNVKDIVADFRLNEFLDVLKEQEREMKEHKLKLNEQEKEMKVQGLKLIEQEREMKEQELKLIEQERALKEQESSKQKFGSFLFGLNSCELCFSNLISYYCEECTQCLCEHCHLIHSASNVSRFHKVVDIATKRDEFETNVNAYFGEILKKNQAIIRDIKIEEIKTNVKHYRMVQELKSKRNELHDEIDKRFDELEKCVDFTANSHLAHIRDEKELFVASMNSCEPGDLKHALDQNIKVVSQSELVIDLMRRSIRTEDTIKFKGIEFDFKCGSFLDSSNAPSLAVMDGYYECFTSSDGNSQDICHAETRNYSPYTEAHRCDSLTTIGSKSWSKQHQISLPSVPTRIRVIQDELWQCHYEGIKVYDLELCWQKTICGDSQDFFLVYDVAFLGDELVMVASWLGLFQMTLNGKKHVKIADGQFGSVIHHEGRVYAANRLTSSIHVYRRTPFWTECYSFIIPTSEFCGQITLAINTNNNLLYVCHEDKHRIDTYCLLGMKQFSTGDRAYTGYGAWLKWFRYGSIGLLNGPLICGIDIDGVSLIADGHNDCLKVLSLDLGLMNTIQLEPPVAGPTCAILLNEKLYVSSGKGRDLSIYT